MDTAATVVGQEEETVPIMDLVVVAEVTATMFRTADIE
jgi:hypothetical protein